MTKSINEEMKRTLFETSVSHLKRRKNLLTPKSAGKMIAKYKLLFYKDSDKEISPIDCQALSELYAQSSPEEIIQYLDSLFMLC